MKNFVEFQKGIEPPKNLEVEELKTALDRARVICATAKELYQYEVDMEPEEKDKESARKMVAGKIPMTTTCSPKEALHLATLVDKYDIDILNDATRSQNFIKNKLIEESLSAKPNKDRIHALEVLGKSHDIGLFTERKEITIKHHTTEELEQKLQEKLNKYMVVNAQYTTEESE